MTRLLPFLLVGCWPYISEPDPREDVPLEADADTDVDADTDADTDADCIIEQDITSETGASVRTGNTCVGGDDWSTDQDCSGLASSSDVHIRWEAPSAGHYQIDLAGSSFDTVLTLRTPCPGSQEIVCNDDFNGQRTSGFVREFSNGEAILIGIEGYSQGCGLFQLNIVPSDPPSAAEDTSEPEGSLILWEVVDHADVASLKYVELYNPGPGDLWLDDYTLRRYSNGNTTFASVTLPSTRLPAGSVHVVASSSSAWNTAYALPDVQFSGTIDGNGNDVYALIRDDELHDVYGEIGVDGSGLGWDYQDARAQRVGNLPRIDFDASDWLITEGADAATPSLP